ncbi:MAG: helix-turn-helix transcriptional regulator [Lachnospiraceae bacterium]
MQFELSQIITFFMQMQKITNIPIVLFAGDTPYYNLTGEEDFAPNLAWLLLRDFASSHPGQCAICVSPQYLFYGCIRVQDSPYTAYFGPSSSFVLNDSQFGEMLRDFHLAPSRLGDLRRYLRGFAKPLQNQFLAALELLHNMVNPERTPPVTFPYPGRQEDAPPASAEAVSTYSREVRVGLLEKEMMGDIETGHVQELSELLSRMGSYRLSIPDTNQDMNRTLTEIYITCCTLASRAAIRGGMGYQAAIDLQNSYMHRFSKVGTYLQFSGMLRTMFLDFAQHVAECGAFSTRSPLVRKIVQLLQEHLYENYSLSQLASDLGYSASYLSHHFREETGRSINDYFLDCKIREAKYLLSRGDESVTDVAAALSFASLSHFARTFRARTGETPAAFRKRNGGGKK